MTGEGVRGQGNPLFTHHLDPSVDSESHIVKRMINRYNESNAGMEARVCVGEGKRCGSGVWWFGC